MTTQGVTYGDLASRMSEIGRNVMCLCIFTSPGAWPVGKKPHFQVLSSDGGPVGTKKRDRHGNYTSSLCWAVTQHHKKQHDVVSLLPDQKCALTPVPVCDRNSVGVVELWRRDAPHNITELAAVRWLSTT